MNLRSCLALSLLIYFLWAVCTFPVYAQTTENPPPVAGRNVNMVSGTTFPGGDPFLQRQNEPSIAVSTRNPLHLLAGANDYRTVDMPGLPGDRVVGDSRLGLFKSFDGGLSWQSTLLPGFLQDTSTAGTRSPIYGFDAGADPTVRTGTNGLFYYSGIAFDRGDNAQGAIFVSRFIDLNNKEGVSFDVEKNLDPIKYIGTSVIDSGNAGRFMDKPWLAVDIPRAGSRTSNIDVAQDSQSGPRIEQTFPCGNVYIAYSIFLGETGDNIRSQIFVARSTDCGATWSKPIKLSESYHVNQGTTLAVDPNTGHVYIAWRVVKASSQPDCIVVAK
ncbi:MAG: exo-alpha-sialidase [Acidobacteria bacterium]|nr:exo-alpha-sialidase [Acidobacteriota bacterium]